MLTNFGLGWTPFFKNKITDLSFLPQRLPNNSYYSVEPVLQVMLFFSAYYLLLTAALANNCQNRGEKIKGEQGI